MHIKKILYVFLVLTFFSPAFAANRVISLSGSDVEKYGADMTPFIYNLLSKNENKKGGFRLVFPKGKYHFKPTEAYGKYHAITNHDNGYRRFAFPLIGMKNIEIDANGSDFIFHGQIIPFLIENSINIKITNVNIDWEVPFYLEGSIIATDDSNSTVDIRITPGFKNYKLQGDRLIIAGEGWEEYFLGENICFNPETKAVQYRTDDWHYIAKPWNFDAKVRQIDINTIRLQTKFVQKVPPTGTIITFKGAFGNNRHSPAIHLSDAKNVDLKNINIYHAGGMGVIAEKTENIHLNSVNVCRRPESNRILSATADATHFSNCKGKVVIENCLFENMLDDACNMHGTYTKVEKVVDSKTVIARLSHPQQFGFRFASAKDTLQIVANRSLLPKSKVQLKSVQVINDQYAKYTFKNAISGKIEVGDGLENIEWYPEFEFRNNIVQNNRARSILISCPKKVVVEGNTFSSQMTGILFEGDMDSWFESGAVNDVTIRNNKFLDGAYGGGAPHVTIWINPQQKEINPKKAYERNIIIENNLFKTFGDGLLRAHSVDNLQFINNTIEESVFYQKWKEEPVIDVKSSQNVVILGNKNNRKKPFEVRFDDSTRKLSPAVQ